MKLIHAVHGVLLCVLALGLVGGCGGSGGGGGGGGGNDPVISLVSPASGITAGGAVVRIEGGNFGDPSTVTFDGVAATNVTRIDSTTLLATTPAHAAGAVEVAVTSDGRVGTLPDAFIYVTFPPALPPTDQQIDTDVATPGPGDISDPAICCFDPYVYVAWPEERPLAGGMNKDIYFQSSFDRGGTWRAADVRVNTNAVGTSDSDQVVICCSGLTVYVAWMDNRNGTFEPHFNRSVDGGNTWLANDTRLNAPLAGTTTADVTTLTMCCDGNTVVVGWVDDRNNFPAAGFDVFTTRSIDGGNSFAADKRVNTNGAGTLPPLPLPKLCCEAPNVYVVWADQRAGPGNNDVRFNRSTDNGSNWLPADIRIDQDVGIRSAIRPVICCDGGYVHISWRDDRNAPGPGAAYDVYARSSPNLGLNFNATEVRVNTGTAGASQGAKPDICCDAARLYVTWQDNRNVGQDVWFNYSTDGALSFQLTDARLDLGVGAGLQPNGDPQICCTKAGQLTVAWTDGRAGAPPFEVYANFSATGGSTWQPTDTRLDTNTPAIGNSEFNLSDATNLCCDGAFFYAVWRDTRNAVGPGYDIFFNRNVP